jgi:virginiamycin B lyase
MVAFGLTVCRAVDGPNDLGQTDRMRRTVGPAASTTLAALLVVACSPAGNAPPVSSAPPPTDVAGSPGAATAAPAATPGASAVADPEGGVELAIRAFDVPSGSHPHDVAPAVDGGVWYTGQRAGTLGHLDPVTGQVREVPLGAGSAPHGVVVGPDGAPWITDGGLNAMVRVDPPTDAVRTFPLPADRPGANLNTAAFDGDGTLWFTGQSGIYGRLDPKTGDMAVFDDPVGRGPYGMTSTPGGDIWYASLAGSHIARVDRATGAATVVEPPTAGQGARRVWSDSSGRIWVAEWNAGQVGMHDPASGAWREWNLPGDSPQAYAVYVDDRDIVWLTDFGANAIVRFDPATARFDSIELPSPGGAVRQLLGRSGELWGAESAADKLVVVTES